MSNLVERIIKILNLYTGYFQVSYLEKNIRKSRNE